MFGKIGDDKRYFESNYYTSYLLNSVSAEIESAVLMADHRHGLH